MLELFYDNSGPTSLSTSLKVGNIYYNIVNFTVVLRWGIVYVACDFPLKNQSRTYNQQCAGFMQRDF